MHKLARLTLCVLAGLSLWSGAVYSDKDSSPGANPKEGVPVPLEAVDVHQLTKLVNAEHDTLWLLDNEKRQNGEAVVRFKTLAIEGDQDAGIIFRYQDTKNYYTLVASAKDETCALYRVRDGDWKKIDSQDAIVTPLTMHELRIIFAQDRFTAMLDGQLVLGTKDSSFKDAGGIGLWTKVGSRIAFESFRLSTRTTR